jgi:hypothetical protein
MKTPHKHAALIKAWADGAKIQYLGRTYGRWHDAETPSWEDDCEYRVKPEFVSRSVYMTLDVYGQIVMHVGDVPSNLCLTFDPVTRKLITAEKVKPNE